jgi:hypothetical protein
MKVDQEISGISFSVSKLEAADVRRGLVEGSNHHGLEDG